MASFFFGIVTRTHFVHFLGILPSFHIKLQRWWRWSVRPSLPTLIISLVISSSQDSCCSSFLLLPFLLPPSVCNHLCYLFAVARSTLVPSSSLPLYRCHLCFYAACCNTLSIFPWCLICLLMFFPSCLWLLKFVVGIFFWGLGPACRPLLSCVRHGVSQYHDIACLTIRSCPVRLLPLPRCFFLFSWNTIFYLIVTHPSDHSHFGPLKCHLIFFPYRSGLTSKQCSTLHTTVVQSSSHNQWYRYW